MAQLVAQQTCNLSAVSSNLTCSPIAYRNCIYPPFSFLIAKVGMHFVKILTFLLKPLDFYKTID